MQIVKEQFKVITKGKCETKEDILQLRDFGYTKEGIVKKYKQDNKVKIEEARRIVEEILLEEVLRKRNG